METKIFTVYPIVNGFSTDSVFTGSLEDCQSYIKAHQLVDVIILQDETYSVYPIVNGFSTDSVFSGSLDDCESYIKAHHLADAIILQDD